MKASNAISAKATGSPLPTGRSSDRPPTPTTAESFALSGPSDLPDPAFHAYRRDLADLALAGRVIASHYVDGVERRIGEATTLVDRPAEDAEAICALETGDAFRLLEDSVGWAWGYAGADGRVGYVKSEAVA